MEHQFIATNDIILPCSPGWTRRRAAADLAARLSGVLVRVAAPDPASGGGRFRVWAPDMRGYNLSDKPRGAAAYNLDLLAADVAGLIDAAGVEKAYLVGHDWGGVVAWHVAALYPERLEKLVILNAPHGRPMAEALRNNRNNGARAGTCSPSSCPGCRNGC
jgi:pimeloyl-ACP methyl ester carboxylesterase